MTHTLVSVLGKHRPKWKCKSAALMEELEEAAKLKAEQGGNRLIHPVLPFVPRRCDGQPRCPSVTEITNAASPAVPLPTGMNLPLGIEFNMINPEQCIQAKSGRVSSVKQPGICCCAYRRHKSHAQLLGQTELDSQVHSIFSISLKYTVVSTENCEGIFSF